jgi:putative RecB family exonuclease
MTNYNRDQVLTVSGIKTFHKCPEQFRLLHVDKVQPRYESPEARRGTAIHKAIAEFTAVPWGVDSWALARKQAADVDSDIDELFQAVEDRYGNPPLFTDEPTARVELPFYLDNKGELTTPDNAAFAGTIDLFATPEDMCIVRDYKSSQHVEKNEALEKDLQLRVYGYAALKMNPSALTVRLEKHYIRHAWGLRSKVVSNEMFENVWNEICTLAAPINEAIRTGDFETRPSTLCGWCEVREHCTAWNQSLVAVEKSGQLLGPQDAPRLVELYAMAKSKIKEIEAALRAHVDEYGPIESNAGRYGYGEKKSGEYDPMQINRILSVAGFESSIIADFLKVRKTDLDKFASNKRGDTAEMKALKGSLREQIKQAETVTHSTPIGFIEVGK